MSTFRGRTNAISTSTSITTSNSSRRPSMLRMILRPSTDRLEELRQRAIEVRESKSPDEFIRWFRAQTEATKQEMDAKLAELNEEVERQQPRREDFGSKEAYDEAVGIWMLGAEEAMKGVRSWSQFFQDLVDQIKTWLQKIMDAIINAVKEAYEKIRDFIDWFSKEVVQACHDKVTEFFQNI